MIKRYNDLSFVFGIPGLILQVVGNSLVLHASDALLSPFFWVPTPPGALLEARIGTLLGVCGTALLLAGFAYYARAKGRHPAWCLLAFFSCFGFIVLALLEDRSQAAVAARPGLWQVTTHARPFVIHNPVVGFLNLQGERGRAALASDAQSLAPLFSECRISQSEVPSCQVLFVYCDIDPSGRIANTTDSLRGLAQRAGAYIAIVASENGLEAYKKALEARVEWSANLVLVLDRKGEEFSTFFHSLFEQMKGGTSMLMAWVKLAPQIPGTEHAGVPESLMLAEAGHITFG